MRIALLIAVMTAGIACGQSYPVPNEARIVEIAGWLPEEPSASGARITDRKAWDRYRGSPEGKKIIAQAALLVKQDVPDMPPVWYLEYFTADYIKDGDSRRWREPFWKRMRNLTTLVLAECIENKGRFLKKIIQYLELMPTECAWTEPSHDRSLSTFSGTAPKIDLGVAERCNVLAYAVDWLKDRLPVSTKEKVLEAIRERAFRIYLSGNENWSRHNWNPVCNGCVIRAALALEPDRNVRARFVEAAERTAPYFLSGFRSDGFCGEGLDYWNYGFSRFLPLVLDVRRVTGGRIDLGKLPRAREAMAYAYGFQLEPFVAPRLSDGSANVPSAANLALGRLIWPDLTCARAERFDPIIPNFQVVPYLAFSDEAVRSRSAPSDTPFTLPSRTWFPDAQLYFGRPAPDDSKALPLSVCVKGGWNNDPHNHNDVGTYILMLGGVEIVSDPGGEEYTKRTFSARRYESRILNSYGHPVPVVDGALQKTGATTQARVLDMSFSDDCDEIVFDLSPAYGLGGSTNVSRRICYHRNQRKFMVEDKISSSVPVSFETAIITFARIERTKDPTVFFLVTDKPDRRVKVTVGVPEGAINMREEQIENPKRRIPTRIGISLNGKVTAGRIVLTYEVAQ